MPQPLTVPFYSQTWDLDRWSDLGFSSRERAEYWMWSSCGVLALKSAIDAGRILQGRELSPPIHQYIRDGLALGAYTHQAGWFHAGLVQLAEKYRARAKALRRQSPDDVRRLLDDGYLVIASIKEHFTLERSLKEKVLFWRKRGGHLVLVTGYEPDGKTLILNHSSIAHKWEWPQLSVGPKTFSRAFTGSAIAVKVR